MQIEDAVYQLLKTDAAVTAIVSGRIFQGVMPQEVHSYPGIVYRAPEDGGRAIIRTLEGGCTLVSQRIKVFSAAHKANQSGPLDIAVIKCLDEFSGTVTEPDTSPEESIEIQGIYLTQPDQGLAHAYQYVDKTKLHEFISEFDCYFIDPSRISESDPES